MGNINRMSKTHKTKYKKVGRKRNIKTKPFKDICKEVRVTKKGS